MEISSEPTEAEASALFSESFELLFTKVLYSDSNGVWHANTKEYKEVPGVTLESAEALATGLNGTNGDFARAVHGWKGWGEFAKCVFKGMIPGSLVGFLDWEVLGKWARQKAWDKMGKYVAKHAAKHGLKDALKLSPAGMAGALAGASVGCLVWG